MSIIDRILGNASEMSLEDLTKKYDRLLTEREHIEVGFQLLMLRIGV